MNHLPSEKLRELVAPFSGKPAMVHSDLFVAAKLLPPVTDCSALPTAIAETREARRIRLLQDHTAFLTSLNLKLLIPAFNYQFLKTGFTDLRTAPIELGPLNQFMLKNWAADRTFDPVFSFALGETTPIIPLQNSSLTAFGAASAFDELVQKEGVLLMYGPSLSTMTLIHHIEYLSGGPLYRYDKLFNGIVTAWDGSRQDIIYRYHVRPKGQHLDYDWVKLRALLQAHELWHAVVQDKKEIAFLIPVKGMVQLFLEELGRDPLYLLNAESRAWVEPLVNKLQRRFLQSDFE